MTGGLYELETFYYWFDRLRRISERIIELEVMSRVDAEIFQEATYEVADMGLDLGVNPEKVKPYIDLMLRACMVNDYNWPMEALLIVHVYLIEPGHMTTDEAYDYVYNLIITDGNKKGWEIERCTCDLCNRPRTATSALARSDPQMIGRLLAEDHDKSTGFRIPEIEY